MLHSLWVTVETWGEAGHRVGQGFFPALALIVKWLYDWQTLIAGICALIAAKVWGRAVIRAAELQASAMRPKRAPVPRQASSVVGPPSRDLRLQELDTTALSMPNSVEKLRVQIRALLGRIPHSEEPLNSGQLSLCKSLTNFTIDEAGLKREAPRQAYAALKVELTALANLTTGASCTTAWKVLTSLNKKARELETAVQGEALSLR